jgi:hypothetical protein
VEHCKITIAADKKAAAGSPMIQKLVTKRRTKEEKVREKKVEQDRRRARKRKVGKRRGASWGKVGKDLVEERREED